MPRGRKKKFKFNINVKTETLRSVLSLLLILLAIVSFISFFAPSYIINEKIQQVLRGLFGLPSILLVFILAIAGLVLIDSLQIKIKEPRILISLVIMLLCLSSFVHLFVPGAEKFNYAAEGRGGGIVGYHLSNIMTKTVSAYGAAAVTIIGFIISFILLFDISLDQVNNTVRALSERLNLPFLKKKEEESEDDEVDVSSGVGMEGGDIEVPESSEEIEDIDYESTIEVIQPKYEPEMALASMQEPHTATVGTYSPNIPRDKKIWELPSIDLLDEPQVVGHDDASIDEERRSAIKHTLKSFGINVDIVGSKTGPTFTQYILKTDAGVKISKITGLQSNLALALRSPNGTVRIEAPIPGTSYIGIEVPNEIISKVYFKSLITSDAIKSTKSKIGIILGKDVGGSVFVSNIAKMPHMLIAGTTGSGKSVFIHNLINTILFRATPQEVKFILVDPKRVELQFYKEMPHLMSPVISDTDKAPSVFKWAEAEMDKRYKLFESAKVNAISDYNEKSGFQAMPYILIVIDELGDIMVKDPSGIEKSIIRLAQLARATGIHLVLATQSPRADIITGLIKANIPCRVSFNVNSAIDSRVIIDQTGAEKLLGNGDMLYLAQDSGKPKRLQGGFISNDEILRVVDFLKSQGSGPDYKEEVVQMMENSGKGGSSEYISSVEGEVDELFDQAVEVVMTAKKASTSLLQRHLQIGYARAARIMDELERNDIVGPQDGNKPREVLMQNLHSGKAGGFEQDDGDEGNTIESIQSL